MARELTKMHEELLSGPLTSVIAQLASRDRVHGEITVILGAPVKEAASAHPHEISAEFKRLRDTGIRRNDAIKAVAEKFGLRKNDVYRLLLEEES